jgi:signal transduction histidine kinase/CheY-like chemotaxis protein
MRLTTRILLLVLLCLAPMVAALVYTQVDLRQQRNAELNALALRQAELANADLDSTLEGVHQLLVATAASPAVFRPETECNAYLAAMVGNLPAYKFLALANSDGRIVCASDPQLLNRTRLTWFSGQVTTRFGSGAYSSEAGVNGPFLPVSLPLPRSNSTSVQETGRTLIAALDLDWLGRRLEQIELERPSFFAHSRLTLLDRGGIVIAGYPITNELGKPGRDPVRELIGRPTAGVARIKEVDGAEYVAGYTPAARSQDGLTIVAGLFPPDLLSEINRLAIPEAGLIALSTVLAILVATLTARRFILRPISRLLDAAARWRDGDFTARANLGEGAEFGTLAASFNEMAAVLEVREHERRNQAELLEAQVAQRTHALSETNNRLQVEIAERERSETALLEIQKLQAVGQLAGGVAHDFNNLLATVLGCLDLMDRRISNLAAPDRERLAVLVERASDAVQRGGQLTSRLLAFSRRQHLAPRATDLNHLVTDLLSLASSTIGRRIPTKTELSPNLWQAWADPGEVEAAILNLCLNARDAMPEGGTLTIRTKNETIDVSSDRELEPGRYVRLSVADTGTGMAPEVLQRAVDPFFTTKGPAASGLGLSQAYGLARQSGGTLRVCSVLGQGTEVSLLLPCASEGAAVGPVVSRREAARLPSLSMRVLLVDDDRAVRQVEADMLRDFGCAVEEAANGVEAIRLLEGPRPDLLIVDYAMAGMNGVQLVRTVKKKGITVPVLLATGYAELTDDVDGRETLIDAVIRKPFTLRELHAAITSLMNQRRAEPDLVSFRQHGLG